VLRPRKPARILSSFMGYASHLPYMYRSVLASCHGVHIEKMTFDAGKYLKKLISVPPTVDEQAKIVRLLETTDKELRMLERQHKLSAVIKRGLMQKLLSGDIELSQGLGTLDRGPDHDGDKRHDS
jgi:hypothetical protein